MKKQLLTYLFALITLMPVWATGNTGEEVIAETKPELEASNLATLSVAATRQFKELDRQLEVEMANAFPLFEEGAIFSSDPIDSAQYYVAKAQSVLGEIRAAQRYVGYLDGNALQTLPVGIHKEINGLSYDIGIASVKLKPQYAELEVYMQFEVPQNGKVLTFRAKGIKFTKAGGIVGDATLELVADYAINLSGDKSQIILKSGTFVTFDCSGFQSMGITADVKFSRDLLLPEDESGRIIEGNVISSFDAKVDNWNDLVVQVSLPAFQVKNLEGVGFSVLDAVFDFSDLRNAPSVKFPVGYESTQMLPDNPNLWRGFYLRELSVRLPDQFSKKGETGRTTFAAYDVLIDNMGFSGLLVGTKLLTPKDGDLDGWSFSIDSLSIELQANTLKEAAFNGGIVIPIGGEDTPFEYSALINIGNEYVFNVSPAKDLQFKVFQTSEVEIYEASYLEVKLVDGKFRPKANLHGKMSIAAKLGDSESSKKASLADITFENLELQSVKPYIKIGAFSFGSEAAQQAMANLPISINNIGMRSMSDTEVGLDFDIVVNLTESFSGAAGLTIVGKIDTETGFQSWKFKRVDVNEIMIDVDQGAFKFYGRMLFYRNDLVYGNGFNGIIDAEFSPGIKVKATAIFGSVTNMRYWYADALVEFSNAIPIFTGVGIYGFGGGAYYHMKMDTEGVGSEFGTTNSGVVYVPDSKSGLGLKATIKIGSMPTPEAFSGDATFEISFFAGGGVRYIAFSGNAYLMVPPMTEQLNGLKEKAGKVAKAAKVAGDIGGGMLASVLDGGTDDSATEIYGAIGEGAGEKGSVSAHMFISYDFENRVLHGNFEMFINVAGGIIKGVGPGGRAGWAVMHFAPHEWYIYIGTPDDRCGISAGVGPISVNLTSYFMVGTKILSSPPPPAKVSEILGGIDLDYMGDENALGTGKGFAFGAAMEFDTGDLTFFAFYSRFQAGLGFDIMLKNYGDNVRCKGRSKPMGVNGWYANGQMYAYFDGKVGIRVRLFGKKKNVEILSLGAAAVLQTKLPNPFWMRGIVGGHYSVLGGLVKGNCKFEVVLGEECDMIGGSVLDGIQVIADATPAQDEKEVDVFNTPQAVFNMPIMQNFVMVDVDDVKKTFRIKLDHFRLVSGGAIIPGDIEWNDDKTVAAFNSYDVLPSEKKIDLQIKVSFQEKVGGAWTPVVVDGKTYIEELNTSFESRVAPDYIPHNNVVYSYPVINQYNFYPKESPSGYIKLEKGQSYLFEVGAEWNQVGRFTAKDGSKAEFNFAYSTGNRELTYTFPTTIKTNQIYAFEIINTPAKAQGKVDRNVSNKTNKVDIGGEGLDTEITTKQAEGTIDALQEKSVFTAYIRSSQYSTFSEKIDKQPIFATYRGLMIPWSIHFLKAYVTATEYFDAAEISGVSSSGSKPLISLKADVSNNAYYTNYIQPLVYNGYPLDGDIKITYRDVNELGLVPVRAITINQSSQDRVLTDADIQAGTIVDNSNTLDFRYNLAYYYAYDFFEIQNKVVQRYINKATYNDRVSDIIWGQYPVVQPGDYKVRLEYILPGKTTANSTKQLTLKYGN
jgi:hypothetical protein